MPDIRLRGNLNIVSTVSTDTLDIGTPSRRFNNLYAKVLNADNLAAPGTTNNSFAINTDAGNADTSSLVMKSGNGSAVVQGQIDYAAADRQFKVQDGFRVANRLSYGTETLTTTYTVTNTTSHILFVDGTAAAFTITLPPAANFTGSVFTFKRIDNIVANVVTIDANAAETIDGVLTDTLTFQYDLLRIVSNGTSWLII